MMWVNVDSVLDLLPTDGFGPHHFSVTALYPGETEEAMESRKTPAVKGHLSSTSPGYENAVLHKRVGVPYNRRQQFVQVVVFQSDQIEDDFMGQATVPIMEPGVGCTAPYPLLRAGVPNGTVTLNVQVPAA